MNKYYQYVLLKKNDKCILQPIPSHEFIIYVLTKCCKFFKQFGWRNCLKSYVMPMPNKSKKWIDIPYTFYKK